MNRSLVINGKFLTANPTGVHRVAEELILAMDRLAPAGGDAIRVFAPRDIRRRLPLGSLGFSTGGTFRRRLWEQVDLPREAGDAVVLSLCNIGPAFARRGVTMIHDAQVHITPGSYSAPFRAWYRFIQPIIGRHNAAILTVSAFSADQIARYGVAPRDKITVVHNGVDHVLRTAPDPTIVDRFGLDRGRYALALSSRQAHKNVAVLLRAFARPELAGLRLVLFGADGREVIEAARTPVPATAVFTGRVDDGELRALMEGALCLAFPSTTEGFGLPPLEAMRLGCPAVVAPCGALPEICGDAAVYVDPNDPAAWAAALRDLADDPERRASLARTGIAHAERFTWDAAARQVLRVVDEVGR
jgi:glycosyltransferase involved in cell wall biosynthesis